MKIEGKSGEVTKTQLKILIEPPSAIFSHLLNSSDLTSALNYAEGQLRIYREDAGLMNEYLFAISLGGQRDRAITFLKSGLENQPISVAWHRCYQDEYNTVEGYARLADEYDQRLLENPNNAALLYLRGRICPDRKTSDTYFERAKEADESLAWPYFSLSVAAASDANWQEARRLLDQARDRKLPLSFLDRLDREVRFATEDLAALEVKLRSFVENTPAMNSMKEIAELCDLLVVQGKSNEIAGCVQSWNSKLPQGQPRAPEIVGFANALLRRADDFDEATINQLPQDSRLSPILRVYTRVTRGDPVAAAADPDLPKLLNEPYHAYTLGLALSLSFSLKGATDDADKWREVAADSMSKADKDNVLGAKLLRATTAPTDEQLHEVVMLPDRKMLLLAVLAQRFPERQRELLDFARRLNMGRSLTYHLVKKATDMESW